MFFVSCCVVDTWFQVDCRLRENSKKHVFSVVCPELWIVVWVNSVGIFLTIEQFVRQDQQKRSFWKLKLPIASGRGGACQPQFCCSSSSKDSPSFIDVKGFGKQKEFIDKKEDLQQWSKKSEAFFVGMIKVSELMLEESVTPTKTNVERGVSNLGFALQHMHTSFMVLTIYEANDIVANSRKRPLEDRRRLQKRFDPTTGRNMLRTNISFGVFLFSVGI